jgi:hypothetical protein
VWVCATPSLLAGPLRCVLHCVLKSVPAVCRDAHACTCGENTLLSGRQARPFAALKCLPFLPAARGITHILVMHCGSSTHSRTALPFAMFAGKADETVIGAAEDTFGGTLSFCIAPVLEAASCPAKHRQDGTTCYCCNWSSTTLMCSATTYCCFCRPVAPAGQRFVCADRAEGCKCDA